MNAVFTNIWRWQDEVGLDCNYRNYVGHPFGKEELFWQLLIYLEIFQFIILWKYYRDQKYVLQLIFW